MILAPDRSSCRIGSICVMESDNPAAGPAQDTGDDAETGGQGFGSFLEMFQSVSTTDSEDER